MAPEGVVFLPNAEEHREIEDPLISIGVLAQQVGLSVSAVRKYENEGLIIAHRTTSGHRLFSREDISRVRTIQHLIQDLRLNIEGIRRIQALLPCWELLPCTAETRKTCSAYKDSTRPCWMIKGLDCAPQGNECRQCAVYRFGSLCTEDIKQLLHDQTDLESAGAGIHELMQMKKYHSTEEEL
ncbi:MAG: MerR family transcriptional regulator [Gemmatimonadales bacterium]